MFVDFIEGLPTAPGGLNSIATVTDKFTKAIRLLACKKSDTGMAFTQRFYRQVYPIWGVPARIISDCDCRFVSAFWTTLMRLAGTKIAMTTAYHPQADGQGERTNRTLQSSFRILCLQSGHAWLDLLPHVELAHNTTPCSSTGFSPFSLLYSHPPHLFGDRALPVLDDIAADAETLAADLRNRRALASDAMTRTQAMQKRYFDARHSPLTFLPGDLAMLVYSGTLKRPHKLAPTGSVIQIIEAVSPFAYRVRVPSGSHMHDVISVEHLQPYRSQDSPTSPSPTLDSSIDAPTPPAVDTGAAPSARGVRTRDGRREVQVLSGGDLVWTPAADDLTPPLRRSQRLLDHAARG